MANKILEILIKATEEERQEIYKDLEPIVGAQGIETIKERVFWEKMKNKEFFEAVQNEVGNRVYNSCNK